MNLKEQENKLVFDITIMIVVNILIWVGALSYMGYRLFIPMNKSTLLKTSTPGVPTIKQANVDTLRKSFKIKFSANYSDMTTRPEPFD